MIWKRSNKEFHDYFSALNRRDFFKSGLLAALAVVFGGSKCTDGAKHFNYSTYESLGVRPVINCWGTISTIGGSLVLPVVRRAIEEAGTKFVFLEELMEKVSDRLAELTGAEGGIVTSGATGALMLATAACVAGTDPEKMAKLPDCSEMKNEVIAHRLHRHGFEHIIHCVGAKIIECDSIEDMESKINERTAMISALGNAFDMPGSPTEGEMVTVSRKTGVPILVDAAAERPDVPNRYIKAGIDLVAYSGGKCLCGPQSTGLLLGRKDLTWAAYMNSSSHLSIGRSMKVDKGEIVGCIAALEWWIYGRDHEGEWKQWEGYIKHIGDAITDIPTVRTKVVQPGRINVTPTLSITWDEQSIGLSPQQVHNKLLNGEPRIKMAVNDNDLSVNPYMMEPGEERIVAKRLRQILVEKI